MYGSPWTAIEMSVPDIALCSGVSAFHRSSTSAMSFSHAAIVACPICACTPSSSYASAMLPSARSPMNHARSGAPLSSRIRASVSSLGNSPS